MRSLFISKEHSEASVSLREVNRIRDYLETFSPHQGPVKATANAMWMMLGARLSQAEREGELGRELIRIISEIEIPGATKEEFRKALERTVQPKPVEYDANKTSEENLWVEAVKENKEFGRFSYADGLHYEILESEKLDPAERAGLWERVEAYFDSETNDEKKGKLVEVLGQILEKAPAEDIEKIISAIQKSGAEIGGVVFALSRAGKNPDFMNFDSLIEYILKTKAGPDSKNQALCYLARHHNFSHLNFIRVIESIKKSKSRPDERAGYLSWLADNPGFSNFDTLLDAIQASKARPAEMLRALVRVAKNRNFRDFEGLFGRILGTIKASMGDRLLTIGQAAALGHCTNIEGAARIIMESAGTADEKEAAMQYIVPRSLDSRTMLEKINELVTSRCRKSDLVKGLVDVAKDEGFKNPADVLCLIQTVRNLLKKGRIYAFNAVEILMEIRDFNDFDWAFSLAEGDPDSLAKLAGHKNFRDFERVVRQILAYKLPAKTRLASPTSFTSFLAMGINGPQKDSQRPLDALVKALRNQNIPSTIFESVFYHLMRRRHWPVIESKHPDAEACRARLFSKFKEVRRKMEALKSQAADQAVRIEIPDEAADVGEALGRVVQPKPVEFDPGKTLEENLWAAATKGDPWYGGRTAWDGIQIRTRQLEWMTVEERSALIEEICQWEGVDDYDKATALGDIGQNQKLDPLVLGKLIQWVQEDWSTDDGAKATALGDIGQNQKLDPLVLGKLIRWIQESSANDDSKYYALGHIGRNPNLAQPALGELIRWVQEEWSTDDGAKVTALGDIGQNPNLAQPALGELIRWVQRCHADNDNKALALGDIGQNPHLAQPALGELIGWIQGCSVDDYDKAIVLSRIAQNPHLDETTYRTLIQTILRSDHRGLLTALKATHPACSKLRRELYERYQVIRTRMD